MAFKVRLPRRYTQRSAPVGARLRQDWQVRRPGYCWRSSQVPVRTRSETSINNGRPAGSSPGACRIRKGGRSERYVAGPNGMTGGASYLAVS